MAEDGAPAIVWLRQDLRLSDNPALHAAHASKRPLVIVYLLDDETPGAWRMGAASHWWLHKSLESLAADIEKRGGRLILRNGAADREIPKLAKECGAAAIHWNRCYEGYAVKRDTTLKEKLGKTGVEVVSHNGALLNEPWTVKTKTGDAYKVFTPYWRAAQQIPPRPVATAPKKLKAYSGELRSDSLNSWRLLPTRPNWAKGFETEWAPGEAGAEKVLFSFIDERLEHYADARDLMGKQGTSRLSPYLHFGEISPVQVCTAVATAAAERPSLQRNADKFMSEIGWREFSANLLFHWPTLPDANWRDQFDAFPWRNDAKALEAWKRGRTGYPVVDAAMRELWTTGVMHNRARMIAASFLIKHLLIDWREGEKWFWDTLVDADLANNAASWQWVAGSGADASPYFRIFNPVTQGERYDAEGAYVRRWVPELGKLPDAFIHQPWEADEVTLRAAGVELGRTYPKPIVEHTAARERALAALATLSSDA